MSTLRRNIFVPKESSIRCRAASPQADLDSAAERTVNDYGKNYWECRSRFQVLSPCPLAGYTCLIKRLTPMQELIQHGLRCGSPRLRNNRCTIFINGRKNNPSWKQGASLFPKMRTSCQLIGSSTNYLTLLSCIVLHNNFPSWCRKHGTICWLNSP